MTAMMTEIPHTPVSSPQGEPDRLLGRRLRAVIFIAPLAIVIACVAMCIPPQSRRFYEWLTDENSPVEMLTFLLALAAAVMGARFVIALVRRRQRFAAGFYILFALGMFFIGMEEISWGQQLFGWKTPETWGQVNAQGETTLHNFGPFQGHNDILRFAFGFGGLFGLAVAPLLPRLRVLFPNRILVMWFLVIAGISAAQLYCDAVPNGPLVGPLNKVGDRLAEVVELLITIAAVLYLWLNARALRARREP